MNKTDNKIIFKAHQVRLIWILLYFFVIIITLWFDYESDKLINDMKSIIIIISVIIFWNIIFTLFFVKRIIIKEKELLFEYSKILFWKKTIYIIKNIKSLEIVLSKFSMIRIIYSEKEKMNSRKYWIIGFSGKSLKKVLIELEKMGISTKLRFSGGKRISIN
ncbi:MAG: hypothetical protein A2041_11425 [Bacteroidetes bacterium GWA2_31_9b]|nr:MAG: hypothetical protein A2041_11425 [Bacteroidetes bacterium GWA2_31_9b]